MMNRKIKLILKSLFILVGLYVLVISGLTFAFAQEEEKKEKKPTPNDSAKKEVVQPKFALFVGVSNYKNKNIPAIAGCENNVSHLADTLIEKYAFKKENVLRLINDDATKEAIKSSFRSHLVENAKKAQKEGKEAVIVYYFCGHGSQYPDQEENDENDGKDETFVAYDSRTEKVVDGRTENVFDILDDEMDDLKAAIRPFTTNTTLIFESCNSGTASRGEEGLVRQEIDTDDRKRPPYKREFPPSTVADEKTYVAIGASMHNKKSLSHTKASCNCDKPLSLMTEALVEGLRRASDKTTYRGLLSEVSSEVAKLSHQNPQVEGNRDAILFKGAARRARPYIEIQSILKDNRLIIKAGRIHGLKEGGQVSIYSSESTTNTGKEHWLTNGIISEVRNFQAVVQLPTLEDNSKVEEIRSSSHVVLASPVFGGGSLLIALNPKGSKKLGSAEKALHKEIGEKLKLEGLLDNQIVKLIPSEKKLSKDEKDESKGIVRLRKDTFGKIFALEKGKDGEIIPKENLAFVSLPKPKFSCEGTNLITDTSGTEVPSLDKEVYYLDDGASGGMPLFGKFFYPGKEGVAEEIAQTIRNYSYQANLRSLDNTASTLSSQIEVTLRKITDIKIERACIRKEGRVILGHKTVNNKKITSASFTPVQNNRLEAGNLFQLQIENISGKKNRERLQNKDAGGMGFHISVVAIKNSGEIEVVYYSNKVPLEDTKKKEFVFRTTKPIGSEIYKIIISQYDIDFSFYESAGVKRSSESILETILTQSGNKTRNSRSLIRDEPDQWGVKTIELNIEPNSSD